ncbi:MAG: vitamin B12 dependent-methionine synthase activation domain-containing protein [Synergistaceae bacterium]|nr:vitamin B12 dependent-methionine synthase activation domain-containing protein [Synergistaceae bacterium]
MAEDFNSPEIKEAAILLGIPEDKITSVLLSRIREQYMRIKRASVPRSVFAFFDIEVYASSILFDNTFYIRGRDLADVCRGCKKAALMAATLGSGIDILLRRAQTEDMSNAVILDACASAEIERVTDLAEGEIIKSALPEEYLRMRFSPGYGDVPLEESQKIISALNAERKIGLKLTGMNMLVPMKSVTAVIGISESKTRRGRNCALCNMKESCAYKKRGGSCGI